MKKKSLDDEMFNAVLEQAFTEAVAEEFADVPDAELMTPDQPKKKRSGPLNRFLDSKTQEAFDAINSLIDERLQDIKASIEANAKMLIASILAYRRGWINRVSYYFTTRQGCVSVY